MTTSPPHKAGLVLIDVENALGSRAQRSVAVARLTAVLEHVPAQARLVAACSPARIRPDVEQVLADHGVKLLAAGTGPDAADKVLLNRARQAAANGVTHFTVVSADAAFAPLALLGELHVLAWEGQPVGKMLAKAATVHRIPHGRRARPSAQPRPAPARPAQTAQDPAPEVSAPAPLPKPPAQAAPPPNSPRPRSTARWGGAAATVMFCGGLAFGAGTALGSRLVHRALDAVSRPRT
ncbi:hypothetical protein AB0A98_22525 [Streptomyces chrestomyceticus]|uniref:hypothetical protein n=1 Tax=Streptomyces chrestomyceticus TaxID=68185 RepID=UPI0033CA71B8